MLPGRIAPRRRSSSAMVLWFTAFGASYVAWLLVTLFWGEDE